MGITGLLPIFYDKFRKKTLLNYKNTTFGVDAHVWLYQTFPSIAEELFYNIPTKKHVELFKKKMFTLIENQIKPVFVFDGDSLPAKEHTNKERRERKEKTRNKVLELLKRNKIQDAKKLMRQCVSVKDEYVYDIIQMLKQNNIEYIISPYESDAQLCYLQKINYVDYLLTQDSDLIVYGCTNILYNFKEYTVEEYNKSMLKDVLSQNFCKNLIPVCILSGCDYLPSIKGVGLKTAIKLIEEHENHDAVIDELSKKKDVPKTYKEDFRKAYITFKEQVVYDPLKKERVYLSGKEVFTGGVNFDFLGNVNHHDPVGFAEGKHLDSYKGPVEEFAIKKVKPVYERIIKQKITTTPIKPMPKKVGVIVNNDKTSPFIKNYNEAEQENGKD